MRRTPLARGAPLARGGPLRRGSQLRRAGRAGVSATGAAPRRRAPLHRPRSARLSAEPTGARLCQGRLRGAPGGCCGALHRHHVVRRSQLGPDTPENLLWVCAWHHAWLHDHVADARLLGLLA
jgi:hypothetical protein